MPANAISLVSKLSWLGRGLHRVSRGLRVCVFPAPAPDLETLTLGSPAMAPQILCLQCLLLSSPLSQHPQSHPRICQNDSPPNSSFLTPGCRRDLQDTLVRQEGPIPSLQMGHLRPRDKAGAAGTRALLLGPLPPLAPPAPPVPPPPSCWGLIRGCGKWIAGAVGTGGPRASGMPGRCRCGSGLLPWADWTNLLNCNSPWLRELGPGQGPH